MGPSCSRWVLPRRLPPEPVFGLLKCSLLKQFLGLFLLSSFKFDIIYALYWFSFGRKRSLMSNAHRAGSRARYYHVNFVAGTAHDPSAPSPKTCGLVPPGRVVTRSSRSPQLAHVLVWAHAARARSRCAAWPPARCPVTAAS